MATWHHLEIPTWHNALFLSRAHWNILHCFWHFCEARMKTPAFSVEGTLSPSRSFATCQKLKLWNAFLNRFERLSTAFEVVETPEKWENMSHHLHRLFLISRTSPTGLQHLVLQPVGHRLRCPTVQVKRWVQTHTCRSKGSRVLAKVVYFNQGSGKSNARTRKPACTNVGLHRRERRKIFFDLVFLLESASKH